MVLDADSVVEPGFLRLNTEKGNIFVGGRVGQQDVRLTHEAKRGFTGRELLATDLGRIRDIKQGLDGYIYLVTDDRDGKPTPVLRLEPVERQTK